MSTAEVAAPNATLSARPVLVRARILQAVCRAIEATLALVVAGSVVAIGAVHPWAYVPLWILAGAGLLLLGARAFSVRGLRRLLGPRRFAFHVSGRWIILEPGGEHAPSGWSFDLSAELFPRGPLVLPGLLFAAWALAQSASWPGTSGPWTISPGATARGLAFVLAALGIHQLAAATFVRRQAQQRFREFLASFGLLLALVGLVQSASGAARIYGFFAPAEGSTLSFGPFVNRNHFAGYMLMVVPIALAALARAWRHYVARVGTSPNLRRRLVALQTPEGVALVYAVLPPLFCTGALVATTSRGALLACAASLVLAAVGLRRTHGVPAGLIAAAFFAVAVSWFGIERLETRFGRATSDAPGRALVWRDALRRMDGLWLTGSGFNTFGLEMSRVSAWRLPTGATPWPEALATTLESRARVGYRSVGELPRRIWYREAHNDYVQLLVETGIPGLLIALWAAWRVLAAARPDPWLLAALSGVLLHELVDFDLQIPALATLFVVLAAPRDRAGPRSWSGPRRLDAVRPAVAVVVALAACDAPVRAGVLPEVGAARLPSRVGHRSQRAVAPQRLPAVDGPVEIGVDLRALESAIPTVKGHGVGAAVVVAVMEQTFDTPVRSVKRLIGPLLPQPPTRKPRRIVPGMTARDESREDQADACASALSSREEG